MSKRRIFPRVVLFLVSAALCASVGAVRAFGQAAGEPRAGGRPEKNVRYLLPPSEKTPAPKWTAAEKARGYVVYSDTYMNSFWPMQKPTRAQIAGKVGCVLARDEYEPIQVGVYGVDNDKPLEKVTIAVDVDLPFEVRVLGYRDRTPNAADLKNLGTVDVPFELKLGDTIESISPGHTGAFWITFHATADAKAGKHAGQHPRHRGRQTGDGNSVHGQTCCRLRFPSPTSRSACITTAPTTGLEVITTNAKRTWSAHGMNTATLYAMPPGIKIVKDEITPDGRIVFSDAVVEEMKSRQANGLADPDVPLFLADYDLVNWHSGSINDPLSQEEKLHAARLYNTYCAQHNWPRIAAQMHDEPTVAQPKSFYTWSEGVEALRHPDRHRHERQGGHRHSDICTTSGSCTPGRSVPRWCAKPSGRTRRYGRIRFPWARTTRCRIGTWQACTHGR